MDNPAAIGKYQIQGTLGQGGMGTVYKAFDPAIHRQVAIKTIIKSALDPADLQYVLTRFRHEAQAVGRLTHPRIVAIYDYGEDMDLAYIVMELVNGKTLFHHIQNRAQFSLKEIGEIVRQLLDGLGYAHGQGVTHRDVKPANLLINDDGRIKISDFGIARIDSSTLTQVGEIMGSPGYMSPEQFLGTEINARSDIYSVGVITYELLAGRRPFIGNNAEIMSQALNVRPVNPSEHNPKISVQLDWAVHKALAKKQEDRFQDAKDFSDAFVKGIEASIRMANREPELYAIEDAPTQNIDPKLVQAARMLAGLQPAKSEAPAAPDPVAPPQQPAETPAAAIAAETPGKNARILFVDDEERILTALRSVFRANYHVFTATNGKEALDLLGKFKPHVVVSDQRMPEMTGVELLRQVKDAAPSTVRLLLTGYSDLASIVGSINEGEVFRFISKPWDNQEIQKTMGEAVAIALELAEATVTGLATPDKMNAAILVVERGEEAYKAAKQLFSTTCPVLHAKDLEGAFAALESQETALIIADIERGGRDDLIAVFKVLKQEHPEILTIVLTEASDSELVIDLINQAQIFRFVNKPVNLKLLKQHAQAALERYQSFQQAPQLAQSHKVEPTSDSLASKFRDRVQSLKGWLRPVIR